MPTPEKTANDKNIVQSLAKGFRVLEAFTSDQPEASLAEIARRTGSDNATAFRLLNTLLQLGYVERVSGTRLFRLTLKCVELGFNAIARSDLRTLARPLLRGLVGTAGEAASVGVLDGSDVMFVERVQFGLAQVGVDIRIGTRVPAYSTAIGHAILAQLPREQQVRVLEAGPREQRTARTPTDLTALLAILDQARARGFALSDQENVTGLRVLAAPVCDVDGAPIGGLSTAASAFHQTLAEFEARARDPVIDAAHALSRALQAAGGYTATMRVS